MSRWARCKLVYYAHGNLIMGQWKRQAEKYYFVHLSFGTNSQVRTTILLILDIVSPGILVVCGDSIPLINVWIPNFTYILLYNAYLFMSLN